MNKVFSNGDHTYDRTHIRPLSKDAYHERYCKQEGTKWVYNPNKPQPITTTHWYFLEADCYVPMKVHGVPAMDKVNIHLQDETETELYREGGSDYTVDEYRSKFCTYDSPTNRWYYTKT